MHVIQRDKPQKSAQALASLAWGSLIEIGEASWMIDFNAFMAENPRRVVALKSSEILEERLLEEVEFLCKPTWVLLEKPVEGWYQNENLSWGNLPLISQFECAAQWSFYANSFNQIPSIGLEVDWVEIPILEGGQSKQPIDSPTLGDCFYPCHPTPEPSGPNQLPANVLGARARFVAGSRLKSLSPKAQISPGD